MSTLANKGKRSRRSLADLEGVAKSRGGLCLSKEYLGMGKKHLWQCSNGHKWWAVADSVVLRGSWCPYCNRHLGEAITRLHFEVLLGEPFPKSRPNWLKNSSGNQLELDGFNPDLKLAFEHQGSQHSRCEGFGVSLDRATQIKINDQQKKELCLKNNVRLIEVPSVLEELGVGNIRGFLKDEFIKAGLNLPFDFDSRPINLEYAYKVDDLGLLRKIANVNGGDLLSKQYLGIYGDLTWVCSNGHTWEATPNNVLKHRSWCPHCSGNARGNLEFLRKIAISKGGLLLSDTYKNNKTKLEWQCEKGHIWYASPDSIKNHGTWCPKCNGSPVLTIKDMMDVAEKNGGLCLSGTYQNQRIKLLWQCSEAHRWYASATSVRNGGTWCPQCSSKNGWKKRKNVG